MVSEANHLEVLPCGQDDVAQVVGGHHTLYVWFSDWIMACRDGLSQED